MHLLSEAAQAQVGNAISVVADSILSLKVLGAFDGRLVLLSETRSEVAQPGLKLSMQLRMTLNL